MAKCTDVIGIGEVLEGETPLCAIGMPSNRYTGYFRVRIYQPFVGCVSNQEIRVHQRWWFGGLTQGVVQVVLRRF